MKTTMATMLLVLAATTTLAAQEPAAVADGDIDVTRAVIATGIEDREPIGVADIFPADVGQLYFYTVIEGDFGEAELEHVWLREGEEMARVPLTARGPRWRTWSSKRIVADWTGAWTAQVIAPDGAVLESIDFTVEAAPTATR